jgi:hypothetical protein
MINESRLALILSALALITAVWQTGEARRANALNTEDLRVEIHIASPTSFDCATRPSDLKLRWIVQVSNNSVQPVLIRELRAEEIRPIRTARSESDSTTIAEVELLRSIGVVGESFKRLPFTLAAKTHTTFELEQNPVSSSRSHVKWAETCKLRYERETLQSANKRTPGDKQPPNTVSLFDFVDTREVAVSVEVVTSGGASFIGAGRTFNPAPFM